jgi:2',3'-cyclic-nucleotide 2'-phosphodiesterase (5'-nucleotidase family)
MFHLHSLINSSSLLQKVLKKGNITNRNVNNLFPYGNTVDRVVISGKSLLDVFFASINSHKTTEAENENDKEANTTKNLSPHFHFQMSGIKVTFDNNPLQPQVVSIKTACKIQKECSPIEVKKWCQLNVTKNYTVALSSDFIGKTGTGVGIFAGLILEREVGDLDRVVFTKYVKECTPMNQTLSGRIINQGSNTIR